MMNSICTSPNLLINIFFFNETKFLLNGIVNYQNCQYWYVENPCWWSLHPISSQVNVWELLLVGNWYAQLILMEIYKESFKERSTEYPKKSRHCGLNFHIIIISYATSALACASWMLQRIIPSAFEACLKWFETKGIIYVMHRCVVSRST